MDNNSPPDNHLHLSIFGLLNAKATGPMAITALLVIVLMLVFGFTPHALGG